MKNKKNELPTTQNKNIYVKKVNNKEKVKPSFYIVLVLMLIWTLTSLITIFNVFSKNDLKVAEADELTTYDFDGSSYIGTTIDYDIINRNTNAYQRYSFRLDLQLRTQLYSLYDILVCKPYNVSYCNIKNNNNYVAISNIPYNVINYNYGSDYYNCGLLVADIYPTVVIGNDIGGGICNAQFKVLVILHDIYSDEYSRVEYVLTSTYVVYNSQDYYTQIYNTDKLVFNIDKGISNMIGIYYESGYNEAYNVAYNKGYNEGVDATNNYSFLNLLGAVVDAPLQAVSGILNFDILGFNMLNFFYSLVTLSLVIFVVRLFL